ncbi:MAG: hypothetical protein R2932_19740 [Caldilineaceae bacterium]
MKADDFRTAYEQALDEDRNLHVYPDAEANGNRNAANDGPPGQESRPKASQAKELSMNNCWCGTIVASQLFRERSF